MKKIIRIYRVITSPFRALPDFIIIGTMRGGTTSLFEYLSQHPQVVFYRRKYKELHFFSRSQNFYDRGVMWYKRFFPLRVYKFLQKMIFKKEIVSGEATPYYLFHPRVPARIKKVSPKTKFIVLLRNPVERAYSHYNLMKNRYREEKLPFNEAIRIEKKRLADCQKKILADKYYDSKNHQFYSYLERGKYVEQLSEWFKHFPREQFLILKSEDFFADPEKEFKKVCAFLNIDQIKLKKYIKRNSESYSKMNPLTKKQLKEYFEPFNKKLYKLLNRDFGWD